MNYKKLFASILMSAVLPFSASAGESPSKIDSLYARMTPGERLAQLRSIYLGQFFTEDGKLDTAKCRELIPDGIGHFSQFAMDLGKTPDEQRDMVAQMQQWLMTNTPSGIPAMVHEEALTGVNAMDATVYPQQIGQACSFNTALAEKKTWQTATALRRMGGRLALSPMVDVVRNPSFNRLEESYGEDAYLSAAMGVAFVNGLQHNGDLRQGIPACTKHFLGYGGGGQTDKKELIEEILLPHEAIIRTAGSQVVMTGYHDIDGTKCVANRWLQTELLRGYVGFDGLLVSDYSSIPQISEEMSEMQRGIAAFNAGNEVDFPHGRSYRHLLKAMEEGSVTSADFEKAVKRVLKLKEAVGLLDSNPSLYDTGHIALDSPEERQTSYEIATQSVVLLKNAASTLPIQGKKKVFLTGPNANTMWAMAGDYSYQSMHLFWKRKEESPLHPKYVFLKEGMENRLPQGMTLSYSRGCDWTEVPETVIEKGGDPRVAQQKKINERMIDSGEKADWNEALQMAAQSDIIVAAMGENALLSGENRDRTHLRLPGRQEEYVKALIATGKPVVLVVFGGRAQVISGIADGCAAIIQAWYPGEEGGNAVADILYGNVSPSGKLSVSYPAQEINEAICYNNGLEGDKRIAWPFGYGMSYTTFDYSALKVDTEVPTTAEDITLSLNVKNSGKVAADEIVQVYVSPVEHSAKIKSIQLQGFARVSLQPGEEQQVKFILAPSQMGYSLNGQWAIDPGRYIIKVGASSQDIRLQQEISLTGKQHTMPLRKYYLAR